MLALTFSLLFLIGIDLSNPESLVDYALALYVPLMPVLNWIMAKYWPSYSKKELILKTSIFGIAVLVAIISVKGITADYVIKAIGSFITSIILYDKLLNPAGLKNNEPYKTINKSGE